jgi:glycosyltransferase involved in cell wall biosynthesis
MEPRSSKTKSLYSTFVSNKATGILPLSIDAERRALAFVDKAAKVRLIYLGVEARRFHPAVEEKPGNGRYCEPTNARRKWLETFVRSAAYLPETGLIMVGTFADDAIDYLRSIASNKVRFVGALRESELIRCYQDVKVYVEASAHEAFRVSLAEGMACECVPVVTDKGAIHEVVGDTGVSVPYGDPEATAEGIKSALESDKGRTARKRIEERFSVAQRSEALLQAVSDLLD